MLIVGVEAVTVEVAKNIVLAGIKSLVLLDKDIVKQRDLAANFFLNGDDLGLEVG